MRWRRRTAEATPPAPAAPDASRASVGASPAAEPALAEPTPKPKPTSGFVGRAAEQQLFRELLAGDGSAFVQVSGTARTGRRALLEQFCKLARETGAACAPVVALDEHAALELDELLERLASGLEDQPNHLAHFGEALDRFRSREAGRPTRTAQALAIARAGSSTVSQLAGALPVRALNTAIQSPLGDMLTERAEKKRTLDVVGDAFVSGLVEIAGAHGPVVLAFSDLDFAPSSAKLLWLRRSLFPRVAHARVVVAVSTEAGFELDDVAGLFGRAERIRLERFTPAEAAEFLEGRIGLRKDSTLGRAVLEDSDCFPERLAGYAQYFEEHPAARDGDRLPTEARDLTAGGLASGLLARISDPFLRDVLLHAAPLRWFNAELLAMIAEVCEIGPDADGHGPGRVLDLGMRPSWVTNVGGGWGIDVETRRRAIVDEFRRLHPMLYRRVHLHAADYHMRRLCALEGRDSDGVAGDDRAAPAAQSPGDGQTEQPTQEPNGQPDQAAPPTVEQPTERQVFAYRPTTHPTDRLTWNDYLASLGEWLYHLVALAPRRGFARLADFVGEALAWGRPAVATTLVEIGVEVPLPGAEVLARQRLLDVAHAMHNERHAETLLLVDEFVAAGSASLIADAAAGYVAGTRLGLLGRSPLKAQESFERAERLLVGAGNDVQARSLRCLNLTRLAAEKGRRSAGAETALALLARASELARTLDPRMQAEISHTRGAVLNEVGRIDDALAACDEALELLRRAGAAAEATRVLCRRADVNIGRRRFDAARRDLLDARSIYRQLVDPGAEAQVLVALLEIALRDGDEATAAEQEAAILALRPDDFLVRNQLGVLYSQAGRYVDAIERYTEALAMTTPESGVLANRGRARRDLAATLAADATAPTPAELRGGAGEDLTRAFALDPDDLDTGIDLAVLRRELGDGSAAAATAELVAGRAIAAAHALPPPPAAPAPDIPERAAVATRLRDLLVRSVTLLDATRAAALLGEWTAGIGVDEELELMLAIAEHELCAEGGGHALLAAIDAATRAVAATDPPRGRALVELAAVLARARRWHEAKDAALTALADPTVRVQAQYMLDRLDQLHRRDDEFGGEADGLAEELVVDIAEDLSAWFDPTTPVGAEFFGWMIAAFRGARRDRVGLAPPGLWIGVRRELPPGTVHVVVDNAVRVRATIAGDLLAALPPADCLARAGVTGQPGERPWDGGAATWLPLSAADELTVAGVASWDPRGLVLATLDEVLEVEARFVCAEEAATLSGEAWDHLTAAEFFARADTVRALLEARVPPRDLPGVLADYREAPQEYGQQVLADAIARLRIPVAEPGTLAAAFARGVLREPGPDGADAAADAVEILVRLGAGAPASGLADAADRVIAAFCDALHVPAPTLRVEVDPNLEHGGIAVAVGGVTRLVSTPADALDWWQRNPVAGQAGRTGIASGGRSGQSAGAIRALEAVLWDDPALVLPHDAAGAARAFAAATGSEPSARIVTALLQALAHRVPLGPPERLKPAVERLSPRSRSGGELLLSARIFESKPRRPIPDALRFGIRDMLRVDEHGRLRQLRVRVVIHHSDPAHLRIGLTGPSGLTVALHDHDGDLERLRAGADTEQLPQLVPLLDEQAEGPWTLHVQDVEAHEAGVLEEWAIELTTVTSSFGHAEEPRPPTVTLTRHEANALERLSSLERDMRSRRIEAECGAGLWAALEEGVGGGRLERERVALGTHLARELGLHFGHSMSFAPAADLPDHGFRIYVNGLARASGELRPGRYGHLDGDPDDVWVGPLSGAVQRRLPDDAAAGYDAPDRLMRHVRAAVREAAAEFADSDWAVAFLDRLAHTYPVTVPALRTAAGDELLAALLRELVTQGIAVGDPRLIDETRRLLSSPDADAACKRLAASPPGHLGRTAGALAESLRERLDRGAPDPAIRLLELGPTIETAIRSAVGGCDGRVPVYALPRPEPILARLERERRRGGQIAVVCDGSLRRHVHRLIAAQFPTVEVIARGTLGGETPREVVDLTASELV